MTDLERVREIAGRWSFGASEVNEVLDSHLKEDAEREDRLMDAYTAMDERDAELARLRKESEEWHDLYDESEDEVRRLDDELTRLREENAALHLMAQRPDMDLFRENARLRDNVDALSSRPDWTAYSDLQDERDGLREQVDGLWETVKNYRSMQDDLLAALRALEDLADGFIEASADALEVDETAPPAPRFVYRVRKIARAAIAKVEGEK